MAATSRADTVWVGDLASGSGRVKVASEVFAEFPVSWAARTERRAGTTSPEELLAAAHSACFSMAFASGLSKAGHSVERLATTAEVEFVPGTGITTVTISVTGRVPGIDGAEFHRLAEVAKDGCPVSKALKGNVELKLSAKLES